MRCAADESFGDGCSLCADVGHDGRQALERAVRGGLGALPIAWLGAWIGTQYVHAHIFSVVVPGLIGLACSAAAMAAAGPGVGGGLIPLSEAAVAAVIAVALGDSLDFGTRLLTPIGQAGPPYLAALAGVAAWPLLFGGAGRG